MYNFIYTLFMAIATGEWKPYEGGSKPLESFADNVMKLILNAFGGNFSNIQEMGSFFSQDNALEITASIVALVGVVGLFFLTWRAIKAFLGILLGR